jgi:hypothetical protein
MLAASVGVSSYAYALVGENAKQVNARYGRPDRLLTNRGNYREVGYAYRGFMLIVKFVDGVSKSEIFARPEKSTLTEENVRQVLSFSVERGQTWRDLSPLKSGDRCWGRSDGKVMAVFPFKQNFVLVQDVHSF